jgi:hypothetical protein
VKPLRLYGLRNELHVDAFQDLHQSRKRSLRWLLHRRSEYRHKLLDTLKILLAFARPDRSLPSAILNQAWR